MRNNAEIIVGAGLSGLIAASMFPRARIFEAAPAPAEHHKALLRFRSEVVANTTGIDFRSAWVHKGIWIDNAFSPCTIRLANLYSIKTLGLVLSRSIWDLDPVQRFIAPNDFYAQLVEKNASRISWGKQFDFSEVATGVIPGPVISTIPMNVALASLLPEHLDSAPKDLMEFRSRKISVTRGCVRGANVYQTVYFPSPQHDLYRASITGDVLIMEFATADNHPSRSETYREARIDAAFAEVHAAFGIAPRDVDLWEAGHSQRFGKIAEVDDTLRKSAIGRLSSEFNVYSLGRFATWRNILLDDVVNDARVIKKLIGASDYERKLKSL